MTIAFWVSYMLLWILVAALIVLNIGLLRQLGQMQQRLGPAPGVLVTDDGLPIGQAVPEFVADVVGGHTQRESFPPPKGEAIVIFLTPTCGPCQQLVPALNRFWRAEKGGYRFYVLCKGDLDETTEFAQQFGVEFPIILDPDGKVSDQFRHQRAPFAFLVSENHTVVIKGVVNDELTLDALIQGHGSHRGEEAWRAIEAPGIHGRS